MSVTFWCPDAPRKRVPCPFCADYRQRGWIQIGERCDQHCNGTIEVSDAPECSFSQDNSQAILRLLGFQFRGGDLFGQCSGTTMKRRITKARNGDRSAAVRPAYHKKGGGAGVSVKREGGLTTIQPMGAELYECGNTDEETVGRLEQLWKLATWAKKHGQEIQWA